MASLFKLCPFCSGRAAISDEESAGRTLHFVKCGSCGTRGPVATATTGVKAEHNGAIERATERWNERFLT